MPELPEVETIKRTLKERLTDLTIRGADILLPKIIQTPSPEEFCRLVVGKKILDVGRRGKYLLLSLSRGLVLVVHLRMTGQLVYTAPGAPRPKHTHLVFYLSNAHQLRYTDTRQFGRFWLVPAEKLQAVRGLKDLGVEPLSGEFTVDFLKKELKKRRTRLKPLLLNQTFISGLGNIYADEALHRAGLHPARQANTLTTAEAEALFRAIREVLEEGIASRGTSVRDYVDGTGQAGSFQEKLRVYGKSGQPCPRCGLAVARLRLGGRSAYFCPGCQK
ncbi:bifunctional DNA-formamidopyrimidine glycosylase/DNA-(apurinic or apyrimidinic site) lyase [Desulfofundulus thermocisternus]|uniref:bifunctional DNA-formamidopyrimidine glycosylase/DNA-(apurinic or apyrimidinic site) lyase n=1 Tax=Desulfofundulus thermocisternus TaxID=42471 RepID=UPI0004856542|nr:bifunctional DNA-formamidopyrimidine glycosylase/DNA-(apurinic or apyrimidinic site) lyase [Desulfofundulus thermocisternus]